MNTKKFYYSVLFALATLAFNVNGQTTPSTTTDQTQQAEKPEFKPSGNVWGYTFGDYYYMQHEDALGYGGTQYATKANGVQNAFDFRRIYLGYDYNISENFSTQVLLANESDAKDILSAGAIERTFYIKAANVKWKNFVKNNDLIIGQQSTPIFATISEGVWGYRSIEKTVGDMRGLGNSNDVGIAIQGKLNDKGDYGYNLMVGNGNGASPEVDKYKKFYGEVYAKFLDQKIVVELSGTDEPNFNPTEKTKTTFHGFLAYNTNPLAVGFEIIGQTQKNAETDTTTGSKTKVVKNAAPMGMSFFVRGQIIKEKLNFFARYDNYNPDGNIKKNDLYTSKYYTENFITAGLDYTPNKKVHLMPNIWYDGYSNMLAKGTSSDHDMALRLTFWYIFK